MDGKPALLALDELRHQLRRAAFELSDDDYARRFRDLDSTAYSTLIVSVPDYLHAHDDPPDISGTLQEVSDLQASKLPDDQQRIIRMVRELQPDAMPPCDEFDPVALILNHASRLSAVGRAAATLGMGTPAEIEWTAEGPSIELYVIQHEVPPLEENVSGILCVGVEEIDAGLIGMMRTNLAATMRAWGDRVEKLIESQAAVRLDSHAAASLAELSLTEFSRIACATPSTVTRWRDAGLRLTLENARMMKRDGRRNPSEDADKIARQLALVDAAPTRRG